jgi:hypothetical protein
MHHRGLDTSLRRTRIIILIEHQYRQEVLGKIRGLGRPVGKISAATTARDHGKRSLRSLINPTARTLWTQTLSARMRWIYTPMRSRPDG